MIPKTDAEKAKETLLSFFECIMNTLTAMEKADPGRFKGSILDIKPSSKLKVLISLGERKSAEFIADLYIESVIKATVIDRNGNEISVRELLSRKDEEFILKHIFKLIPAANPADISVFVEIWKGIREDGTPAAIKLSENDKIYGWKYFEQIDRYISRYMGNKS
jgi:hypothetical protein